MDINSYLASKGLTSGVQTDNGQITPFQMPDWMLSGKANNPDEVFGMPQGRPVLYDSTGRVLSDAETWKVVAESGNTGTGKGGNADGQYGTAGALFNPWAAGQNEFQYGQTPAGYQIGSQDPTAGNLGNYGAGYTPTYDPTYGWVIPNSPQVMDLQQKNYANTVSNNEGNDFEAFMTELPRIAALALAGGGIGSALSGAGGVAAGAGEAAAGTGAAAGGIAESSPYWSMLADGSGVGAGTGSAAAGTVGTTAGAGSAAAGSAAAAAPNGWLASQLVNLGMSVETANALATAGSIGGTASSAASAMGGGGGDAGVQTYGDPSITGAGASYNLTPAQIQQAQSLGYSGADIAAAGGGGSLASGGFSAGLNGAGGSGGTGSGFFDLAKAAISTPGVSQLLSGGLNALGGYLGSQAQAGAVNNANDLLWRQYQQNREDLTPYRMAGYGALGGLVDMTTPGKQLDRLRLDPGYDFRKSEGQQALDSKLRAGGKFYSGTGIKAAADYNQNFASNEFNSAYNRLAGLSGTGQSAANTTAQLGQNTAQQAANNTVDIGNARASGYGAIAGGLSGALNSYNNAQQTQQLFDLLSKRA